MALSAVLASLAASFTLGGPPAACVADSSAPRLDHVIIAVRDLDAASAGFVRHGFRLKPGRLHANGLLNRHIKFRDGTEQNFLSPITTKPWGTAIPKLAEVPAPTREMRASQLLYNEPKWIRMDEGGLRTLKDAGLKLKKGVYY